jgi:hypothetical protein
MELSHVGTISESATAGTCDHSKAILHDATVHRIADKAHDGRPDGAQGCAGVVSNTVPISTKLDWTNKTAAHAVCIRLPLLGLTLETRCLRNCARMGPSAMLEEDTERKAS